MIEDKLRDQLNMLGIDYDFVKQDDQYIIDLQDQDEWGKMFSLLENSSLEPDEENDELSEDESKFTYYSKEFTYELTCDFNNDKYILTITEN